MADGLVVENLEVRYGSVAAVRGVSLSCEPGRLVALVGPNGAGKSSTLMAIAGGLTQARVRGEVSLDGVALGGRSAEQISRAGIVLVPERRHIFGTLTVRENMLLGATGWARRREAEQHMTGLVGRFPALEESLERRGGLLSGGQQQQLAIARALMARPRVLLLDEPSLGLSPDMIDLVFQIIEEIRRDGLAVVLVEQAVVRAVEAADQALVMRKGLLEERVGHRQAEQIAAAYLGDPEGRAIHRG